MSDKITGAGAYNRRIQLLMPQSTPNRFNEKQTGFAIAYNKYPAKRLDATSKTDEGLEKHLVSSGSVVEWHLRFIKNLPIKTTWRIKDIFDGKIYQVVSPATEIGNRQGIRVLTKIIE
ncbi:head-tail adaptor protein [Dyadobacter sp. CY327]|uniref:phage head completion protein n=1 Tax=Dyadobacter sp. CY327 TaxID=2907301 RepID=UPI001F46D4D8|nr:head-tail adaptor protein [Dyadobacter sp. CY327]MCE7071993.1 head-tail adaptor protein [Dyadobacter sp. CY327]